MSKHFRFFAFVMLAFVLAIGVDVSRTQAQGGQFSGYQSGIQVQNLVNETTTVSLVFYNNDGSVSDTLSDPIPPNGSKTYFGATLPLSSGFSGSAVISSDKPVAAISNIHNEDLTANASYVGRSQGATTVQLPLLQFNNSGFNSWIAVQNAGNAPANVTIDYADGAPDTTATIPVNAAETFYQKNEAHTLPFFSGVITSDQPVVAVVVQEDLRTILAYTGFTGGSTAPVMPLINANNAGFTTGVQIQNTGSQSTDVTVSYIPVTGTACTETQTIPAGQSNTFALSAFANDTAGENCAAGQRFVGAAKVTTNSANQPLTAIVNQHVLGTNAEAYSAFDPAAATSTVVMPLIMDRNSGFFTGFNLQNVGSSATTVTCTFTDTGYQVGPQTLQPNEVLNAIQENQIAPGYIGSGTCTASDNGQIVSVVNEFRQGPSDQFLVYEGINN